MSEIIYDYLETIDINSYEGVAVIGSYAINEEKKWSDIDLFFLVKENRNSKIEIFKNKYFVSNYYVLEDLEKYFKDTNLITSTLGALSNIKLLFDPHGHLGDLKEQAKKFTWTSVLVEQSKYLAAKKYIGFLEEAQKAIQGLADKHVGKMLNGVYGLSFGMFQVIRLRDQIQIKSDNEFFSAIHEHLHENDPIRDLSECAFGIKRTNIEDQVEAGLEMFMHIGNSMMPYFSDEEKEYVLKLIHEIILVV